MTWCTLHLLTAITVVSASSETPVRRHRGLNNAKSPHPPRSENRRQSQVSISAFHPDVDEEYAKGTAVSTAHPPVHDLYTGLISASHPNIDAALRDPANNQLPPNHPPLSALVSRRATTSTSGFNLPIISIALDHPDIGKSYAEGTPMGTPHPSVQKMMKGHLPAGHPDCDVLLRDPLANPLPSWHPPLNEMAERRSVWSPGVIFSVMCTGLLIVAYLARVREWLAEKIRRRRQRKPELQHIESGVVASTNATMMNVSNADTVAPTKPSSTSQPKQTAGLTVTSTRLDIPTATVGESSKSKPLTTFHETFGRTKATDTDDGTTPSYLRTPSRDPKRLSLGAAIAKSVKGAYRKSGVYDMSEASSPSDSEARHGEEADVIVPLRRHQDIQSPINSLPRRSLGFQKMHSLHKLHRATDPMYAFEEVRDTVPQSWVVREVPSSACHAWWSWFTETRISSSQWTTGNVMFCVLYLLLNGVALLLAPTFSLVRGLGSLAVANTIFLVIPATRNNILTWFLGMPFDHIILHHRFVGRVTVAISFGHGALYFDRFAANAELWVYWTGMVALVCALGIAVTTTDYMRRQHFNVFFWTHYLFVGFFVFGYVHVPEGQPFLLAAIAIYLLDKVLRVIWSALPKRTLMYRNRGERTAQVRWPKNPLTRLMGKHKVGQYVFLNFPELSLTEWHPFSVSSGPNDDYIEVHIRALGNHTRKIVEHATQCAETEKSTLVRSDGPYGYLDFNYRRYGVLMLVGGGIGITPIISILRDIYDHNRSEKPHCMQHIHAVWVMPYMEEADLFLGVLEEMQLIANADPSLPDLTLHVHCTRTKDCTAVGAVKTGRPDFSQLLFEATDPNSECATLVFACGPGKMVNELWDECTSRNSRHQRIDFHHETFEF